ncbi:outer membrane beta-barrel protein [Acetobacter sp. TBRC 12305]|uniref:OmpW family protein n=1 Tax=Acetobacter garciniae TaxID=2817435 RepID=A0A939HLN3_9PROT|nr:OmpW family outer membrane protein [Acetobacter garciniae]MBO1324321.1 OmpW family protein [Acetobacter garciniae]MBX0344010.1 outer membrane beta-barrel protein [Acetobacter garciniae]
MVKLRSLLTAMAAGVATMAGAAQAQAQTMTPNKAAYVNAPVVSRIPDAPPPSSHCGIFETCASTKIGLGKGDFMIRFSGVGILPQDRDGRTWLSAKAVGVPNNTPMAGGRLSTTNQAMPELTVEYFVTDNISLDLIATSMRHEVSSNGGELGSAVAGLGGNVGHGNKVDVGSAWVLPPTITVAYHFRPHKRFNPYVGVGGTMMWFHSMHAAGALGNLGSAYALNKLNVGFTGGPSVNVGFDYQVVGNWFFNADVKQLFVRMHGWLENQSETIKVRAHESLDPTVVSAGIAYRF